MLTVVFLGGGRGLAKAAWPNSVPGKCLSRVTSGGFLSIIVETDANVYRPGLIIPSSDFVAGCLSQKQTKKHLLLPLFFFFFLKTAGRLAEMVDMDILL